MQGPASHTASIISVRYPHIFVRCDPSIERVLGHQPAHLAGNPDGLRLLCLGKPDSMKCITASVSDFSNTNEVFHVALVSCDGHIRKVLIRYINNLPTSPALAVRSIIFAPSQAVLLSEAQSISIYPQVIISAKLPHIVCAINALYASAFMRPENICIAGLPLFATFISSDIAAWTSLLLAAADGRVAEGIVHARTVFGQDLSFCLRCAPVTLSSNERISLVSALLLPFAAKSANLAPFENSPVLTSAMVSRSPCGSERHHRGLGVGFTTKESCRTAREEAPAEKADASAENMHTRQLSTYATALATIVGADPTTGWYSSPHLGPLPSESRGFADLASTALGCESGPRPWMCTSQKMAPPSAPVPAGPNRRHARAGPPRGPGRPRQDGGPRAARLMSEDYVRRVRRRLREEERKRARRNVAGAAQEADTPALSTPPSPTLPSSPPSPVPLRTGGKTTL